MRLTPYLNAVLDEQLSWIDTLNQWDRHESRAVFWNVGSNDKVSDIMAMQDWCSVPCVHGVVFH